jgi:hypothetical protein
VVFSETQLCNIRISILGIYDLRIDGCNLWYFALTLIVKKGGRSVVHLYALSRESWEVSSTVSPRRCGIKSTVNDSLCCSRFVLVGRFNVNHFN